MAKRPKVSVIINTYNEEVNIKYCLQSIKDQSYKNIEIVVVDSTRTVDATKDISKNFTKLVFSYGKERSPQKNYGAKKSLGDYLLFVDADMKLAKDLVSKCVLKTGAGSYDALIIPEYSYGESFWAKCKALERNCYIGDDKIEAARFFKNSVFRKLGGYSENMISGEDWDLTNRTRAAEYKIGRVDSLIHHNEGKLSLIRDLRKKYYYAKNSKSYIEKNVKKPSDIALFIFRPAYFRNWRKLVQDPIHFLGFIVMKVLEFFVGGLAIIRS